MLARECLFVPINELVTFQLEKQNYNECYRIRNLLEIWLYIIVRGVRESKVQKQELKDQRKKHYPALEHLSKTELTRKCESYAQPAVGGPWKRLFLTCNQSDEGDSRKCSSPCTYVDHSPAFIKWIPSIRKQINIIGEKTVFQIRLHLVNMYPGQVWTLIVLSFLTWKLRIKIESTKTCFLRSNM